MLVTKYEEYLRQQDNSELGILLAKLKAQCLDRIIEAAKGETRDALQANKYLLEFSLSKEDKRTKTKNVITEGREHEDLNRLQEYFKEGNIYAIRESREEQI